jgi:hypothetical protein
MAISLPTEKEPFVMPFRVDVDCMGRLFGASDYFGPGTKASAVRSVHTEGTAKTKRSMPEHATDWGQCCSGLAAFSYFRRARCYCLGG